MRAHVKVKTSQEIKASGIIPNLSPVDQGLEDIIEQIKE